MDASLERRKLICRAVWNRVGGRRSGADKVPLWKAVLLSPLPDLEKMLEKCPPSASKSEVVSAAASCGLEAVRGALLDVYGAALVAYPAAAGGVRDFVLEESKFYEVWRGSCERRS